MELVFKYDEGAGYQLFLVFESPFVATNHLEFLISRYGVKEYRVKFSTRSEMTLSISQREKNLPLNLTAHNYDPVDYADFIAKSDHNRGFQLRFAYRDKDQLSAVRSNRVGAIQVTEHSHTE